MQTMRKHIDRTRIGDKSGGALGVPSSAAPSAGTRAEAPIMRDTARMILVFTSFYYARA